MNVAVITSLRRGFEHFVFRELQIIASQGISLHIFPTKYQRGLYNPEPEWILHRWHALSAALLQPLYFLTHPLKYARLLWEASKYHAWVDFALAWLFSRRMAGIDVIYSIFGDHKFFVGYFCKRITGLPLVVTIHAYELYRNPNPDLFVKALAACDQIITVTDYNKELLSDRYGVDPEAIKVVRCSVDIDAYHPESKFVILIVAYFEDKKGHDTLLRAVRELGLHDIEVWVVGSGRGKARDVDVVKLAEDLDIADRVAFFGELGGNALKAMYRSCDVFCLPSRFSHDGIAEGFPTVLMEAMAFGKPVISTRHVEIPRIITEIVVEENDYRALAAAIRSLYESKELRRKLGMQNRAIAERLFSPENARQTASILQELAVR